MAKTAGLLFFLGGTIILMGIITAEIFFNSLYSISQSMISTLGASPPPNSIVREPSASIFDSAMILSGLMIILGAYSLYRTHGRNLAIAISLTGLGAIGVGVFPAFHAVAHPISALLTFAAGAVAAILASKTTKPPFSYISFTLGLVSMVFLFAGLFLTNLVVPVFGAGGTERYVAYPIMIWLIGFGGYLMSPSYR